MCNNRKLLIANWFINIKNGNINNEIFLLSSTENILLDSVKDFIHSLIPEKTKPMGINSHFTMGLKYRNKDLNNDDTNTKNNILKSQYITDSYSIYLMDSENVAMINEIRNYKNKNKNIILITSNNYHYTNYDRPLLNLHLQNEILQGNNFLTNQDTVHLKGIIDQNSLPPSIKYHERFFYYIEILPIAKIIKNKRFDVILTFIKYHIYGVSRIPIDTSILFEETSYNNKYDFNDLIEADVYLLDKYEILTSRLAIIIYRLSFLNFKANKTKIGLFFKDKLKVKSTSINLNNLNVEFINQDLNGKSFRGYELRKRMNSEEAVKLEIAKNLLKCNIKINIISKATKLSKEKIESINLKI